jgi:hypothetical protein
MVQQRLQVMLPANAKAVRRPAPCRRDTTGEERSIVACHARYRQKIRIGAAAQGSRTTPPTSSRDSTPQRTPPFGPVTFKPIRVKLALTLRRYVPQACEVLHLPLNAA